MLQECQETKREGKDKLEASTSANSSVHAEVHRDPPATNSLVQPWQQIGPSRWAEVLELHASLPDVEAPQWCAALQQLLDNGLTVQEHRAWLEYRDSQVSNFSSFGSGSF